MPKLGLTGGGFSSRSMRAERRGRTGSARPEDSGKPKAKLPVKVILRDAAELIAARKGRLALGFGLLLVNRLCGLVLPGTTKILLDDVIGKGRRDLLLTIVLVSGAATLVQAITGFALSQVLGKAAQRSITEMRRSVQRHVGRLSVAFFDQTKTGVLLSRVMTDAEGVRNLVGTGLVELAGGSVTAAVRPRNPLLLQRQADADRPRGPLALRPRPALRVQDPPAALPRALEDQRRGLRTPDRVLLGDPRRQGLPRRAPGGARLREGGPPALPQRGEDDDGLLRRRGLLDAAPRRRRRVDHVGRRPRDRGRPHDGRLVLLVHALPGPPRRAR